MRLLLYYYYYFIFFYYKIELYSFISPTLSHLSLPSLNHTTTTRAMKMLDGWVVSLLSKKEKFLLKIPVPIKMLTGSFFPLSLFFLFFSFIFPFLFLTLPLPLSPQICPSRCECWSSPHFGSKRKQRTNCCWSGKFIPLFFLSPSPFSSLLFSNFLLLLNIPSSFFLFLPLSSSFFLFLPLSSSFLFLPLSSSFLFLPLSSSLFLSFLFFPFLPPLPQSLAIWWYVAEKLNFLGEVAFHQPQILSILETLKEVKDSYRKLTPCL